MQELLRKIRQILKDRKTRQFLARVVTSIAAVVVFVTTYALILPAISMEKTAVCGVEEHQHSDSCYEERLVCGQEESDGHHHDDSCYKTTTELNCVIPEHRHSAKEGCYDSDGNLICQLQEHVHDDSCYEEIRSLNCTLEESQGHHHTDACFEKVLVCGKEVHTHSGKCYEKGSSAGDTSDGVSDAVTSDPEDGGYTGDKGHTEDADAAETGLSDPDAAAEENQPDSYVPELEPLDMEAVLDSFTDLYYFHAEDEKAIPADSAEITDWRKVEEDNTLTSTDLVKMYLAYRIPGGSLNETNPSVRYRMPDNLHLSDGQIDAMNRYENGIAAGYRDFDAAEDQDQKEEEKENYYKYLGAEAVEGERRPDEQPADDAREFISAVVRAENIYDEKGQYIGQDLIFTFVPYSIDKNRNIYNSDEELISAGEEITGWFACDFRLDQIDWEQEIDEDKDSDENDNHDNESDGNPEYAARVIFAHENQIIQGDQEKEIREISRVLRMAQAIGKTEKTEEAEDTEQPEDIEETGENGDGASESAMTDAQEGTAAGEDQQEAKVFKSGSLTAEGEDYTITLDYSKEAKIPEKASLSVREITPETDKEAYEACLEQAGQQVAADEKTSVDTKATRFFDIEIIAAEKDSDGTEKTVKIEPSAPVSVQIRINEKPESSVSQDRKAEQGEPTVLHFAEDGVEKIDSTVTDTVTDSQKSSQDNSAEEQKREIRFEAESFSIYGVIYTVDLRFQVNGKDYLISVNYGPDAQIPQDAELAVEEITEGLSAHGKSYEEYVTSTENALGMEEGSSEYIRLFEISIMKDGEKIQPAEGSSVDVRIQLADSSSESLNVVHFADGAEEGEKVQSSTENGENGSVVEFQADGFSVYSIVDAPEPVHFAPYKLSTLDEIEDNTIYKLSYGSPEKFFTARLNGNGCLIENTDSSAAAEWYFEKANEEGSTFYIYTLVDGAKKYIHQKTSGQNPIELADSGTAFVLSEATDRPGTFIFKHSSESRWLQHSGGGGGIRFFTDANNTTNARIYITKPGIAEDDLYKLDGKSFGIVYNDNSTTAAALTAESNGNRLKGLDLLIRTDVLHSSGNLLVAEDSDIQEWTFESAGADKYYIKTTVDGTEQYLHIQNGNVSLVNNTHAASVIQATPGTGENSGKWHFTVNGNSLNYLEGSTKAFNAAGGSGKSTWLNLVEKSTLTDDDFVEYTARKISASDDILSATEKDDNGEILIDDQGNPVYRTEKTKVVIYTRVWNDTTKKYEFYAVDHDGSLLRVYDSGDQIIWVGNQVNSALWEFTEYTNQDGTPTFFYELENTAYAGKYLAPQSEGIISDQPVGINLNGRREGYDYSSIVAWDDPAYAYSGLKIVTNEDGSLRVVTCSLDEADDFHFAVITPPVEEADPTTEVDTVDNDDFGISIKMIDFDNRIDQNNRDVVQRSYLGYHQWDAAHAYEAETGLVSTNLINGYPTVTANTEMKGESLAGLFDKTKLTPANHLFIQSVYNESGYFEYDSTQNFAHYNTEGEKAGDFTVYNQLGAIGTNTGNTRVHGQFMPYNDISAETGYAHDTNGNVIRNLRDIRGNELPDTEPRKGEPLYSIPQNDADYYFGMELSAVFTQTPDGVDNWGHDIIFEFTGDDDFWFYVDGELVLDLGGVHSAVGGSVNFRTGKVISNGVETTLYDVFKSNYHARGLDVSAVDDLFVTKIVNGETVHVFSDYTTHQMKMFYMERGAGASNLRMRFNLASVKPGTVELSKKLKGAENTSNKLIQYPYQIWYQTVEYQKNEDGTYALDPDGNRIITGYKEPVLLEQPPANTNLTGKVYAVYKGTKKLIPYRRSMKIGGITYDHVFLLRAGETAVINFPENTFRYKLVECGVDTSVYEHVYINGVESGNEIFGKPYNNEDGWELDPDSGEEILPTQTTTYEGTTRSDFGITYYTTEGRPRVEYTNEVPPDVMRTMTFKKVLYDSEGHLLTDAQAAELKAEFSFRLYLGNEFADQENLLPADMYTYYVKGPGPDSEYCKWDKVNKKFVPLGVRTFDEFKTLSEDDQRAGTFTTSIYGAISKIPAGYTVEVRDLIVGTKYKIEEPDREIPKGYTRCDADGYVRMDTEGGPVVYYTDDEGVYGQHTAAGNKETAKPISDTIANKTETPQIEIRNQEGWGLTAQKEWTDKDFMIHDPIYLAIYLKEAQGDSQGDGQGDSQGDGQGDSQGDGQGDSQGDGQGDSQGDGQGESQVNLGDLVAGTVRRLNTDETEVYWFFQDLKIDGEPHTFGEFIVREVVLTDPVVDENGVVTSYSSITPVGEGKSISVSGRTYGGTDRTEDYTVNYVTGKSSGKNENIRTDTVKNSRPGIQIYKTDWLGNNFLSGAVFTLKDSGGNDVGHATYTSDKNGLVTTAYLNEGTFTLNEIRTPAGYVALDQPITITVTTTDPGRYDLTVTSGTTTYYIALSGPEGFYTTAEATSKDMARITVKNRTVQELTVVKVGVDGSTRTPLSGVHFALYDQVRDNEGNVRPAYSPKTGYEDLVTKDGGLLEAITMSLGRGTYYLREKEAPSGYKKLAEDLCFTIGVDGSVVINNAEYKNWLIRDDTSVPGAVSYQISIENRPLGITFRKTDETGKALEGSKFTLCVKNEGGNFVHVQGIEGIGEEGLIDLTDKSEMTFSGLGNGIYMLSEINAPTGYVILNQDTYFSVSNGAVTLTDESGNPKAYTDVSLLDENTSIAVKNNPGAALPHTGGPGTRLFYLLGGMLLLFAGRKMSGGRFL